MVIVKDIELYSLCEHHVLPFIGRAHVARLLAGQEDPLPLKIGLAVAGKLVFAKLHERLGGSLRFFISAELRERRHSCDINFADCVTLLQDLAEFFVFLGGHYKFRIGGSNLVQPVPNHILLGKLQGFIDSNNMNGRVQDRHRLGWIHCLFHEGQINAQNF